MIFAPGTKPTGCSKIVGQMACQQGRSEATGLALLIVVWGFLTWHPGNGGPLYFGVLANGNVDFRA